MPDSSFNRLDAKNELIGAGIKATEADAILGVTLDAVSKNAAAKTDIRDLRKTFERDIERLLNRVIILITAATGIIIAVIKL